MHRLVLLALLWAAPLWAEGEAPGDFDYYVLSLSWSPGFCAREGAARDEPQCDPDREIGWTLHGLWPQYDRGWPSWCPAAVRDPSRGQTGAMADIMGSGGLAWYQWKKHGRCSGLSATAYFDAARRAYAAVNRPAVLRKLDRPVRLPAQVVEEAFLKANPGLSADMITITCKDGQIHEARICLTRHLTPRRCGADIRRDCPLSDALLHPIP